ncbi:hypothetical protein P2P08_18600, partial [Escherichia coli]
RCHRQNMKTSIINGSEVSRLSVAIHPTAHNLSKLLNVLKASVGFPDINGANATGPRSSIKSAHNPFAL